MCMTSHSVSVAKIGFDASTNLIIIAMPKVNLCLITTKADVQSVRNSFPESRPPNTCAIRSDGQIGYIRPLVELQCFHFFSHSREDLVRHHQLRDFCILSLYSSYDIGEVDAFV
jgi:hypothetical protein